jgi:diadenosine tetraphosphate (Ap4A) HIT family hydrolase
MKERRESLAPELTPTGCPFCHPALYAVVYSTPSFLAIYNASPIVRGHTLVVPRAHMPSIFQLDSSGLQQFMSFAALVTQTVLRAYNYKSFDWLLQEGPAAGQSVEHLHLHVIPRTEGDLESPDSWFEEVTGTRIYGSRHRPVISSDLLKKEVIMIQQMFPALSCDEPHSHKDLLFS